MIKNTFSILHGIGERLEKKLWQQGIVTWSDFINTSDINFLSAQKKCNYDQDLISALRELDNANAKYFASIIKRREHWRFFDIFKGEAACLDIETNGFMPESGGYVTIVGIYDGYDYKCFVKDINLTKEVLKTELSRYKYLITFYGAGFDIPFLMRAMPDLTFDILHFDICFGSKKIGFKGGLKRLETELGITRDDSIKGLNGYDAVKLWGYACQGSDEAMDLLKNYNKEDTVNLFTIANIIYQKLRTQTGIDQYL